MRNPRSLSVNGGTGGHDPPRFSAGLLGRYQHQLLPVCCPNDADPQPSRDDTLNRPQASSQLYELGEPTTCGYSEPSSPLAAHVPVLCALGAGLGDVAIAARAV